jgi:hypothetical protein
MGTPTRIGSGLLSVMLCACATTPPGPAVELTTDCRVVASGAGAAGRGGGYGGGAAEASGIGPLAATSDGPVTAPAGSDATSTGGYQGERHQSSDNSGAAAAAAGAAAVLGGLIYAHHIDPVQVLGREGPILPAEFSMSCLPARGFVQRGWPVVIDYVADGTSQVSMEVHLGTGGPVFVQPLEGGAGRHLLRFELPQDLPAGPTPALVLVKARRGDNSGPGRVQILGLGAGPRAVGSVAIDQVDFSPPALRRSARQQASYGFYSRSDFNHVAVEVMRVTNTPGEIKVGLAREYRFDGGVSRGSRFGPGSWDGTNAKDQASLGPHLLQVRAWVSEDEKSWVTAWSLNSVQVSD